MKSVASSFPFGSEVYKCVENKRGGFSIHRMPLLMPLCVSDPYFSFISVPFAYNSNPHAPTLQCETFLEAGPQQLNM